VLRIFPSIPPSPLPLEATTCGQSSHTIGTRAGFRPSKLDRPLRGSLDSNFNFTNGTSYHDLCSNQNESHSRLTARLIPLQNSKKSPRYLGRKQGPIMNGILLLLFILNLTNISNK
ncbi:uncharacterized protein BDCG_17632, partial [Blastomyces dermatitidis ER-3]